VELLARLKPVEVEEGQHWLRLPVMAVPGAPVSSAPGFFGGGPEDGMNRERLERNRAAGRCSRFRMSALD
jgi:hypothetical protein